MAVSSVEHLDIKRDTRRGALHLIVPQELEFSDEFGSQSEWDMYSTHNVIRTRTLSPKVWVLAKQHSHIRVIVEEAQMSGLANHILEILPRPCEGDGHAR